MTTATNTTSTPLVQMTGITVTFPGVRALDGVDFRLFPGEVHTLMGENGAGKSTLIKALTGINQLAAGTITVDGKDYRSSGPADAEAAGISTVYQEVNLCPNITVAENIMLGHEIRRGPFIDWRATRSVAREQLKRMHLDIDPRSQLSSHTIAIQQLCAIARALVTDARVLILDEPTSSLDRGEVAELFNIIRELRDDGVAILFVSHFLEQVYEISDRLTVLRNGTFIDERLTEDLPRRELISLMIGQTVSDLADIEQGAEEAAAAEDTSVPIAKAEGLGRKNALHPFDIDIHRGEIIGFAGLLGSGRTEAVRLLTGIDRPDSGTIKIAGSSARLSSPLAALKMGIAYSTEDRKKDGIIGDLTVRENMALALQSIRGSMKPIPRQELDEIVDKFMNALNIQPRNPNALIKNLSGGNQQKVLLARWLAINPSLLSLDEPTRGIDVGAKAEIQRLVAELAKEGTSIIYISSELEEVVRLCRRVAVMRDREMIAMLDRADGLDQNRILETIASTETGENQGDNNE